MGIDQRASQGALSLSHSTLLSRKVSDASDSTGAGDSRNLSDHQGLSSSGPAARKTRSSAVDAKSTRLLISSTLTRHRKPLNTTGDGASSSALWRLATERSGSFFVQRQNRALALAAAS